MASLGSLYVAGFAINWEELQSKEIRAYETTVVAAELKGQGVYKNRYTPAFHDPINQTNLARIIESGKKKVLKNIEDYRNLNTEYFLVSHPARLFVFSFIAMWLLIVGAGLLIFFPWAHWFVFFGMIFNYCWQTYLFIYDKKVDGLFFQTQNYINSLLEIPHVPRVDWRNDPRTWIHLLHTFLFAGMFFYYVFRIAKDLYRRKRQKDFMNFLNNSKIPADPKSLS